MMFPASLQSWFEKNPRSIWQFCSIGEQLSLMIFKLPPYNEYGIEWNEMLVVVSFTTVYKIDDYNIIKHTSTPWQKLGMVMMLRQDDW